MPMVMERGDGDDDDVHALSLDSGSGRKLIDVTQNSLRTEGI
jgi:hypothetical protein